MDVDTEFEIVKTKKLAVKEAKALLREFCVEREELEDFQKIQIEAIIENIDDYKKLA